MDQDVGSRLKYGVDNPVQLGRSTREQITASDRLPRGEHPVRQRAELKPIGFGHRFDLLKNDLIESLTFR